MITVRAVVNELYSPYAGNGSGFLRSSSNCALTEASAPRSLATSSSSTRSAALLSLSARAPDLRFAAAGEESVDICRCNVSSL